MDIERHGAMDHLTSCLGIPLKCPDLISIALTHPTYVYENKHLHLEHNQRLEFLGDAILGLVVGEYLYCMFPGCPEGDLTKMRAVMVCEPTLSRRARDLNLGSYIKMGRGEEITGGRERASILADVFEAVVGALYLGEGLEVARRFVLDQLKNDLQTLIPGEYQDYKTLLQEYVQRSWDHNVYYQILKESGPDHDKRFVAGVFLQDRMLAEGNGRNKKEAEQQAARLALQLLRGEPQKNSKL